MDESVAAQRDDRNFSVLPDQQLLLLIEKCEEVQSYMCASIKELAMLKSIYASICLEDMVSMEDFIFHQLGSLQMKDRVREIAQRIDGIEILEREKGFRFGKEETHLLQERSQEKHWKNAEGLLTDHPSMAKKQTDSLGNTFLKWMRKNFLEELQSVAQRYSDRLDGHTHCPTTIGNRDRTIYPFGRLRKPFSGPIDTWDSQEKLFFFGCTQRRKVVGLVWDQSTKHHTPGGDIYGWHTNSSDWGFLSHHLGGGRRSGNRLPTKKASILYTLGMAGACSGMLLSGMNLPGGMRTVSGVISTSAAVANVPLHMRSDYARLRWGLLAFCIVSYGVFLELLRRSLHESRRPAYLFFTFLSSAGFIGSALVADKIEDTVKSILTFAPLVATLSAGLLYMPFRYGFGIGANPVEDVEMQPPVGR